eukprot:14491413-Ditylum_brightwellii.AAC.1
MGLHLTSGLTILTFNFSNLLHTDSNDNHGSRFHDLAGKLIETSTAILKSMRKHIKNVKRNMKRLKNPNKNKSKQGFKQTIKGAHDHELVVKVAEDGNFNAKDEDILSIVNHMCLKKSVRIVNNFFIYFYGNKAHCKSKPTIVNWRNGTVTASSVQK